MAKTVIIYNKENGERFEYGLPFNYEGVTYAVDIYGNVIAIEQMFSSGEWQSEEVYAMTPGDIFEVTVTEA